MCQKYGIKTLFRNDGEMNESELGGWSFGVMGSGAQHRLLVTLGQANSSHRFESAVAPTSDVGAWSLAFTR